MPDSRKSPLGPLLIATVAAIAVVAVLVGPLLGAGTSADSSSPDAGDRPSTGSGVDQSPDRSDDPLHAIIRREVSDPMAKGAVDAPVVMVAYSEFQCPFCGEFARDTAPLLEEKYVADGTLRIEWRDFPYLGPESMTGALAGRAAAAQGAFWEFHDAMYADQPPPNSGRLDEAYVLDIADDLGLDAEQFRTDMRGEQTERAVVRDFQEGQQVGVTGTPAFIINGTPVIGAQPVEVFEDAIEQAAGESGS